MDVSGSSHRLARADVAVAAFFVVAATLLAVLAPWNWPLSWTNLGLVWATCVVACRIKLPVAYAWTVPIQIVFVPMLFLIPAPIVPGVIVSAFLAARPFTHLRSPRKVLALVGDSNYALGPAAVFSFAGLGAPVLGHWWIYLAAFASQVVLGISAYLVRYPQAIEDGWRSLRGLLFDWIQVSDVLLSLFGLLVAVAATETSAYALLLLGPLFVLFALFSGDRRGVVEAATELSSAYRGTAMLLGDVVEADHTYTASHSRDVVELSLAVARSLRLGSDARRVVEFGALLHDVGKIAVPKAIIDKPGPLDENEWAVMKQHTIEGQRMLDRVGGALSAVGLVVRASHEHYDGRGYPDGLWGTQIPIEARIVSCCDAFSAMTTDRAYRRAMSLDEAVAELRREAGRQFDPQVVSALVGVVERDRAERPVIDRDELVPALTTAS